MRIRARIAVAACCVGLVLSGCSGDADDPEAVTVEPTTTTPDAEMTLIADADPGAAAISTSRALYDSSALVVLADPGDPATLTLGASAAVALGVPLLLSNGDASSSGSSSASTGPSTTASTPSGDAGSSDALTLEFERLDVTTVLAIGRAAAQGIPSDDGLTVVGIPAMTAALSRLLSRELTEAAVPPEGLAGAFAALDPEAPVALLPVDSPSVAADSEAALVDTTLPPISRPAALTDTFVLASATPESLPGIATARAAGVSVSVVEPEQLDPRASGDAVSALSKAEPTAVIALGAGYAAQSGLDWKLATAATGAQLPGGGQLLFPQRTFVALYGFTEGPGLGVLGEQDAAASVVRAIETASWYEDLVDTTVVPMFEIIATVASAVPGPDGNYSTEASIEQLQPWVDAAGAAGIHVVLDLQPGRTDFLTQAQAYEPLLRLPHVGLALDPEWRLLPNEVHLTQIGSVQIEEVNAVVAWLADLTRANSLPQKLLVLHQFQLRMIQNRELLDTTREELAIVLHVDGQGSQPAKQETWATLHESPPPNVYWGWKNFVDEDLPMLTPEETIAQALPTPELITYQ